MHAQSIQILIPHKNKIPPHSTYLFDMHQIASMHDTVELNIKKGFTEQSLIPKKNGNEAEEQSPRYNNLQVKI